MIPVRNNMRRRKKASPQGKPNRPLSAGDGDGISKANAMRMGINVEAAFLRKPDERYAMRPRRLYGKIRRSPGRNDQGPTHSRHLRYDFIGNTAAEHKDFI